MEALGAYGSDSEAEEEVISSPPTRAPEKMKNTGPETAPSMNAQETRQSSQDERGVLSLRDVRGIFGRDFDNPLFLQRHLKDLGIDEHGTNLRD